MPAADAVVRSGHQFTADSEGPTCHYTSVNPIRVSRLTTLIMPLFVRPTERIGAESLGI